MGPSYMANGIIGTCRDSLALQWVDRVLQEYNERGENCHWHAFGPHLFTRLIAEHPDLVTVGHRYRFYPFPRGQRKTAYRHFSSVGSAVDARKLIERFFPVCPYMFHMWMADRLVI